MATKCLLGLLAAVVLFSCAESRSGVESLYTHFLENLRTRNVNLIAPGEYDSAYRNATIGLKLVDIIELDEEKGRIEILVQLVERQNIHTNADWMTARTPHFPRRVPMVSNDIGIRDQEFVDPRLKWNPEEFDNVKRLNIPRQQIWIPDWEVFNPRGASEYFGDYKATISADGHVTRVPAIKITARCDQISTNGTFECGFNIGSWIYPDTILNPEPNSESISLTEYVANSQWSITGATATRRDMYYPCCVEVYPLIAYTITVEKRNKCKW